MPRVPAGAGGVCVVVRLSLPASHWIALVERIWRGVAVREACMAAGWCYATALSMVPGACLVCELYWLAVVCVDCRYFLSVVLLGSASRFELSPCNTNTHNKRKRPSIGTSHRPSIRHHRKGSRMYITPTSTAAVHASSTATPRHHYAHPAGSWPDPLSQRSPMRSPGRLSRTTTQTRTSGGMRCPPPGGPMIMRN